MESKAIRNDASAWDAELRFASNGLATATLVVLLICSSRECLAETGVSSVAMVGHATVSTLATSATRIDSSPWLARTPERRLRALDTLLAVHADPNPIATARETDASIAAAVARGNDKRLERPKPFRKKSNDLFRSQREVQLGDEEVVVRLRVRPKTRNAMSVEVRF